MADADLKKALRITGELLFVETANEARLSVASQSGTGRVAFAAVGDDCALCASLDGKVFRSDSEDAKRFSPPVHINCDCLWIAVMDDEIGATDDWQPGDEEALAEEIERHGHFITDPEKYQALRVPMGPSGRDFTFRRSKDPQTGEVTSKIEWHRPRYSLGDLSADGKFTPPEQIGVAARGRKPVATNLRTLDQARTVNQLEGWARNRWPHMEIDLKGGDFRHVRDALRQLDRLGQQYREVERSIPSLRVLAEEEFGQLGDPMAWASTGKDGDPKNIGAIKLNGLWFKSDGGLLDGWALDRKRGGGLNTPAVESIVTHEFGEAYRLWLKAKRPKMWEETKSYLDANHPPSGLGKYAKETTDEAFAEAFTAMHLTERSAWDDYVAGLRQRLRYELRRDF